VVAQQLVDERGSARANSEIRFESPSVKYQSTMLLTVLSVLASISPTHAEAQVRGPIQTREHQASEFGLTVVAGYSGVGYNFGEFGLGLFETNRLSGSRVFRWINLYGGVEYGGNGRVTMAAPKVALTFDGLLTVGVNVVDYGVVREGQWTVRPDVGFGLGYFRFVYGYNIPLEDGDFDLPSHRMSVTFILPILSSGRTRDNLLF